jgi:hypothetical protein
MTKLGTKISDAIKEHLLPDEELRSVGQLISGFNWPIFLAFATLFAILLQILAVFFPYWLSFLAMAILGGILALRFVKSWWAGVTGDRLVLIQLDLLSRPRADRVLSIPLDQVEVKNKSLFIDHLMTGSSGVLSFNPDFNAPATMRFRCHFGAKRLTGMDVEEFQAALSTPGR